MFFKKSERVVTMAEEANGLYCFEEVKERSGIFGVRLCSHLNFIFC